MLHNAVATTCTATLITGWSHKNLNATDPVTRVNARLDAIKTLVDAGYKRDFAIIHAFTTAEQNKAFGLEEFMPKLGFSCIFVGGKDSKKFDDKENKGFAVQRHLETGDLYLWAVRPEEYEVALKAFHKELTDIKDEIDPPKKPDPARQKYPDLLLSSLRKSKMVYDNASQDNPLKEILLVPEAVFYNHVKMAYGLDMVEWFAKVKNTRQWQDVTVRTLKGYQKDWKEELV